MPVSIKGSGGGGVTLDAGAAASATTLTLPNVSGTVLQSGTAVTVAQGGTGLATLTVNNVLLGNGTSAVQAVAPGTSGNVLTSNGTAWTSAAAPSGTSISNGTSNVSIGSSGGSITMQTAGVSAITVDTNQNLQFNSGYGSVSTAYGCRAWVNYNGTAATVRASGNISSVTKNGTGDYTLNFATAMPDANYGAAFGGGSQIASSSRVYMENQDNVLRSTSQLRVYSLNGGFAPADSLVFCANISR